VYISERKYSSSMRKKRDKMPTANFRFLLTLQNVACFPE
jgi:hypothetical protein